MDRCITEASRPKRQLAFTALATCSFFAASHAAPAATPSPDEIARSAARIEADVRDVVPIGIEHSTLETVALRAVADAGLTLTPDPLLDGSDWLAITQSTRWAAAQISLRCRSSRYCRRSRPARR
jgi:hypothetical protein